MVTPNPVIKFTYQDYLNTPDDKRYELLDGELVMAPTPRRAHQRIEMKLGSRLNNYVEEHGLGAVYSAPRDVVLSETDIVQPDLMFIASDRIHIDTPNEIWGAPDLVVEILSPSSSGRDRTFKRALYARHGIREYWMVDPDSMSVSVLLLGEHGYEVAANCGLGDTLTSPTLGGFTVDVDELF